MRAVALASRCLLRGRWPRVLLLVAFVGIVGAATMATAAGARRTSSALDRFREASRAAAIELTGTATPEQVEALAALPGVAAAGVLEAYGLLLPQAPDFQQIRAVTDGEIGVNVDRERIIAGRAADPAAVHEVTIGEGLARRLGIGVGDQLVASSFTPEQIGRILAGQSHVGPLSGPQVPLDVVGIVRRPLDLGDPTAAGGLLLLTPAFAATYDGTIGQFGLGIRLRVDGGPDAVAEVLAAAPAILGDGLASAQDLTIDNQGARGAIELVAMALWVCAAVAALAGLLAIALVLHREVQLAGTGQERLGELGCTRWQRMAVTGGWCLPVAIGGALLAAVVAAAASPLFPVGVARLAEPSPGRRLDPVVLTGGALAVLLVVLGIVAVAAHRSTADVGPARTEAVPGTRGTSSPAGLSPAMTIGLRSALGTGRAAGVTRGRSGLVGAAAGILGVAVVLVLAATVNVLVDSPSRFGATWELQTRDITPNTPCGGDDYGLLDGLSLPAVAEICAQNVRVDGRAVGAMAFSPLQGEAIWPTVISGRPPRTPGEVVLGAKTLRALGKEIGDTVVVVGRSNEVEATVVGTGIFPNLGQAQPLADGVVFTGAGYAPLYDQNLFTRMFVFRVGDDADRAVLEARVAAMEEYDELTGPVAPVEVDRLRQIRWLPGMLVALLGGLGLVAVGHALVTSVRRRQRELALLKSLGLTAHQVRASVAWQASTVGLFGLLVGLPVGIALGLVVWRRLATDLGVATTAAVPIGALLLTVPVVLALVNLVALLPARAASRTRPAVALRFE